MEIFFNSANKKYKYIILLQQIVKKKYFNCFKNKTTK